MAPTYRLGLFFDLLKDYMFAKSRTILLELNLSLNFLLVLAGKVDRVRLGRLETYEVVL